MAHLQVDLRERQVLQLLAELAEDGDQVRRVAQLRRTAAAPAAAAFLLRHARRARLHARSSLSRRPRIWNRKWRRLEALGSAKRYKHGVSIRETRALSASCAAGWGFQGRWRVGLGWPCVSGQAACGRAAKAAPPECTWPRSIRGRGKGGRGERRSS